MNGYQYLSLGLQFPELPKGFGAPNYPQFHNNLDGPAMIAADFKAGLLALLETSAKPLYLGLAPSGAANHYQLQVGTLNDASEGFLSKAVPVDRAIAPGQTETFSVSLRFAPGGTPGHHSSADLLHELSSALASASQLERSRADWRTVPL